MQLALEFLARLNQNRPTVHRQLTPKVQKMGCGFHNHHHCRLHRDEFDGRLLDFSYPEVVLVSGLSTTTTLLHCV